MGLKGSRSDPGMGLQGSRSDPGNYRPISLTSICCKTLEHIIYSFIFTHLNKCNILCDNQHGFRSKRSCETQLLGAMNDFAKALNSGEQIDALFLDFSKAFDKVPHERLCHKLSHYGINGHLLDWIKSFLTERDYKGLHGMGLPIVTRIISSNL